MPTLSQNKNRERMGHPLVGRVDRRPDSLFSIPEAGSRKWVSSVCPYLLSLFVSICLSYLLLHARSKPRWTTRHPSYKRLACEAGGHYNPATAEASSE